MKVPLSFVKVSRINGTIQITWKNEDHFTKYQKWKNNIEMNKLVKELSKMDTEFALGLRVSN